jgi:hypothetical protein
MWNNFIYSLNPHWIFRCWIIIYIAYSYSYWMFLNFLIYTSCIHRLHLLKMFFNFFMSDVKASDFYFYFYFFRLTRNPIMQSGQPVGCIIIVHNTKHGHQERTRTFDVFLKCYVILNFLEWIIHSFLCLHASRHHPFSWRLPFLAF